MKKLFLTISLFTFYYSCYSQNCIGQKNTPLFSELMTYTPTALKNDTSHFKIGNDKLSNLNYLSKLHFINHFKTYDKLNEIPQSKLFSQIEKVAIGFFLDGKIILFKPSNGASKESSTKNIIINDIPIIEIRLLHGCSDRDKDTDFIKTFNNQMYNLLKIAPPDGFTHHFNDTVFLKQKRKHKTFLTLNKNRKFTFSEYKNNILLNYSEGFWENRNNTLILNSHKQMKGTYNWLSFNNYKWTLVKNKLKSFNRKRTLKELVFRRFN